MSWDDLGSFLSGTGPSTIVHDYDGTPNTILDVLQGGDIEVDWSFAGPANAYLAVTQFTVSVYADPVSPANNKTEVGTTTVTGPGPSYSVTIPIAANSLAPDAYRLTTLITAVVGPTGGALPIAGFVDGPIIQVRPGP